MFPRKVLPRILALASLLAGGAGEAPAVVVIGSADPNFNDVRFHPPAGPLEGSGLQFVGDFHGFTAVPIGPEHFLAAGHVGGSDLVFRGVTYPLLSSQGIAGTDLVVHRIDPGPAGPFPAWAPLYTRVAGAGSEVGRVAVVFGNGRQRGAEVLVDGQLAGWLWGDGDFQRRWGVNRIAANQNLPGLGPILLGAFDAGASGLGDYEAHLSEFDSSGPMFIQEAGVWKLAGVHYGVEGPFSRQADGSSPFFATLFDMRGIYEQSDNGSFVLVGGKTPQPSVFGSSSVPDALAQILALVGSANAAVDTYGKWRNAVFTDAQRADPAVSGPAADPDGDGLGNLAEYAFGTAPWVPDAAQQPRAGSTTVAGLTYATLSYPRAKGLTDVDFAIEVLGDLQTWTSAPGSTVAVSVVDQGDVELVTVRDATPQSGQTRRQLRVRVTLLP